MALLVAGPAQGLAHRPAEQVRVGLGHDDARAHGIHRQVVEGTAPQRTPCRPGRVRPSRWASSEVSSGRALTSAVTLPGSMTTPVTGSTSGAARSTTCPLRVAPVSVVAWSGSTPRIATTRRAATRARIILSTNSVAVRSGIVRKAV